MNMKKFGLLIFALAIILGVLVSDFFSFGKVTEPFLSFAIGNKVIGSGNVVTEKREMTDFSALDVGGFFQVEVAPGKEYGLEVSADDNLVPLIRTEVRHGTLYIESEGSFRNSGRPRLVITAPNIEKISASGASRVSMTEIGNRALTVEGRGASKIDLSGNTTDLLIDASGASSVNAAGLGTMTAKVEASGASKVTVTATNGLNLSSSGASKIFYSGDPVDVKKRTTGAGSIGKR